MTFGANGKAALTAPRTPKRVVVCGTTFGQVYLEAFRHWSGPFELAGLLARGSARSKACATFYGVPLFSSVSELPSDIDMACVVVRGGLLGGPAGELVSQLLARRIHVLQEQPIHHDELAAALRAANQYGVCYRLNSFYRHLPVVRRFIFAARELLRMRKPLYVHAACCVQVGFPLMELLQAILGRVRPWEFSCARHVHKTRAGSQCARPFQRVDGIFAGVPTFVDIQNQLHPGDPDDFAHLLMRVTVGTESGALSLLTIHGPIVWMARPQIPREVRDADASRLFAEGGAEALCTPYTSTLADEAARPQRELFMTEWPDAVRAALHEVDGAVGDAPAALRSGQHQLGLCRAWQEIVDAVGPPELLRAATLPQALSAVELDALHKAAAMSDANNEEEIRA